MMSKKKCSFHMSSRQWHFWLISTCRGTYGVGPALEPRNRATFRSRSEGPQRAGARRIAPLGKLTVHGSRHAPGSTMTYVFGKTIHDVSIELLGSFGIQSTTHGAHVGLVNCSSLRPNSMNTPTFGTTHRLHVATCRRASHVAVNRAEVHERVQ